MQKQGEQNITPAMNFYLARQYDEALAQLHKVLEMEPNFPAARSVLGRVLVQKGMYEEAIVEYEKVLELIKGAAIAEASVKAFIRGGPCFVLFARWNVCRAGRE